MKEKNVKHTLYIEKSKMEKKITIVTPLTYKYTNLNGI